LFRVRELLRFASFWALACSLTSATVSAIGRAMCMPPYWPAEFFLRCRPEGYLSAILRVPLDAGVTTLLMVFPALAFGTALYLLLLLARRTAAARILAALLGGALWFLLVGRLEPSYLDFIVGGYAKAAGAVAGGIVCMRSRLNASNQSR
jgi:hypothetical protein